MSFRSTPISKIKKCLTLCEAENLGVSAKDLEFHHLAGGDPSKLVEALLTAKKLGVETNYEELSALCLARKDPLEILLESSKEKTVRFDTFSPKRDDKIRGFTKDRQEVFATIVAVFRLSPAQLAWGFDFRSTHERLGAAVSVYINTAANYSSLSLRKPEQEAELHAIGAGVIPGFNSATIEYR